MIFVVLFSVAGALAQAGRGIARLGGVGVDPNGKPIPSAKVVLTFAKDENVKKETTSDKNGECGFIGTGDWTVSASAPGFVPASQTVYVSQLQTVPKVTIKLKIGEKAPGVVQDEASFTVLEQANQSYKDGKYDAALALFQQFLDKPPVPIRSFSTSATVIGEGSYRTRSRITSLSSNRPKQTPRRGRI